jgi:hypothetical protein
MFVALVSLWVAGAGGLWFFGYKVSTQLSMEGWASYAGRLQARVLFQEGHYRLLELSPSEEWEFTGKTNGPFEIWTWRHSTNDAWLTVQTADAEFVHAFNQRMKQMWESRQGKAEPVSGGNR